MTDFAATIHRNIDALPAGAEHDALPAGAAQLQTAIAARVDANQVATLARALSGQLLAVYPVALSPRQPPYLARCLQFTSEARRVGQGRATTRRARRLPVHSSNTEKLSLGAVPTH